MFHCRGANTVTLKRQRSLWIDDQEVVKRSGRDESIQVVIHKCMEAIRFLMLGISLYTILISTSKNAVSFLLLLMSSLQQNWRKGQNRFCLEVRRVGDRGGK
jgi:hypothetical protein